MTTSEKVAAELLSSGYAFTEISSVLVDQVNVQFERFMERRRFLHDACRWQLMVPGENEPDLGLIPREGGEHDIKAFFHYHIGWCESPIGRIGEEDQQFLSWCAVLHDHVTTLLFPIVEVLTKDPRLYVDPTLVQRCARLVTPYNTTTLRALLYPSVKGQKGAKAHYDRSFITTHMGDHGGVLQVFRDGEWVDISPPAGQMVLFFGVKVRELSRGSIAPLLHRSITMPGEPRRALVQFNHHPTQYQVRGWKEATKHYDKLYGGE